MLRCEPREEKKVKPLVGGFGAGRQFNCGEILWHRFKDTLLSANKQNPARWAVMDGLVNPS